jgi:hypothetical protein
MTGLPNGLQPATMLTAPRNQRPRFDADAFSDLRAVVVDGRAGHVERGRDFLRAMANGKVLADFPLTRRQLQDGRRNPFGLANDAGWANAAAKQEQPPVSDVLKLSVKHFWTATVKHAKECGLKVADVSLKHDGPAGLAVEFML